MFDVVTIGSATLDIFVKSDQFKVRESDEFSSGLALCEAFGAKIEVEDIHMVTGGGATNNAVSFARKGFNTACISETGTDLAAQSVVHDLHKEGVNTEMLIQESKETTAVSVIMIAPSGGRSIVTCRGAAAMLEIRDIKSELFTQTKWLYISSIGGHLDVLNNIITQAQKRNIYIAFNPGQKELNQITELQAIIKNVNVLLFNLEEAAQFTQLNPDETEKIYQKLSQLNSGIQVVTDGDKGAKIIQSSKIWHCPVANTPVIEATGAGDAFGSGFISGLMLGWDIPSSAKLAAANAASVIQFFGAKQGLITLDQFKNLEKVNVSQL